MENQIDDQAKAHGISRDRVIEEIILLRPAIKRLVEPSAVAEVARFLCSEAADCITGSMLTIDGGWTAS